MGQPKKWQKSTTERLPNVHHLLDPGKIKHIRDKWILYTSHQIHLTPIKGYSSTYCFKIKFPSVKSCGLFLIVIRTSKYNKPRTYTSLWWFTEIKKVTSP